MNRDAHAKVIHIAKSFEKTTARPKIAKEYILPTHRKKTKMVAILKDKRFEDKKCQWVTRNIKNWQKVLNMNIIAINKISSKLKVWSLKTPNVSYTHRCIIEQFEDNRRFEKFD